MLIDMHTHSSFSPDAQSPLGEMVERAEQLGLTALAVTDHCDVNYWHPMSHYFDDKSDVVDAMMYGSGSYALDSIAAQTALRESYRGKVELVVGVEMGQPMRDIENAEKLAADPRLDFIIGSHHMNAGVDDFYYLDYSKMSLEEVRCLLENCFAQTLEMCRWGKFDVLGHLTYPLRFICGEYGIDVDFKLYDEVIREIFRTLITAGKGIEINSKGLRQKYGQPLPTLELIKIYREMGGEILTLGSDAHCAADLGKGIAECIGFAKAAGFEYAAYFKKHEPQFLKL